MPNITNRDLYEEMRDMRREFTARQDSTDEKVTSLRINEATIGLKVYFVLGIISFVASALMTGIMDKVTAKLVAFASQTHLF